MEQRDDRGRLVWADRSNCGRALTEAVNGRRRALPRSSSAIHGVTPSTSVAMHGDWIPDPDPSGRHT